MEKYTELLNLSNEELKNKLGKVAIMEGDFHIAQNGYIPNIQKVLNDNIILELTNVYREHEQLLQLAENKIDTVLMETTFTYQDKIYDVAEFLIKIYKKTGWKPKRVVNTMDYGLGQLWVICNKLDIEVFRIEDSDDLDNINTSYFQLRKVGFSDFDSVHVYVKYAEFEDLVNEHL